MLVAHLADLLSTPRRWRDSFATGAAYLGGQTDRLNADALASHQFDARMVAGRSGKASVAGEQRRVEYFGQGDVHCVIGSQIVPQFPDARQKEIVRISAQGKVGEVVESHAAALGIDLAVCGIPAHHLRNFNVEQMRRVQCL